LTTLHTVEAAIIVEGLVLSVDNALVLTAGHMEKNGKMTVGYPTRHEG
jgi:hypothetical protein